MTIIGSALIQLSDHTIANAFVGDGIKVSSGFAVWSIYDVPPTWDPTIQKLGAYFLTVDTPGVRVNGTYAVIALTAEEIANRARHEAAIAFEKTRPAALAGGAAMVARAQTAEGNRLIAAGQTSEGLALILKAKGVI